MTQFLDIAAINHGSRLQAKIVRVERIIAKSGGMYIKFHVHLEHEGKHTILSDIFFDGRLSDAVRMEYIIRGICTTAQENYDDVVLDEKNWQKIVGKPFEATISEGYSLQFQDVRAIKYITEVNPLQVRDVDKTYDYDYGKDYEEERYPRYRDFICIDGDWFHEDQI
jgi:hypothetical protein